MDIILPAMNRRRVCAPAEQVAPQMQIVMLTVYEDTENIFNALAVGAAGYLLKRTKSAELLEAIAKSTRRLADDDPHCPQSDPIFSKGRPSAKTTENSPNRQEMLDCLSQGFLYKEIAEKLGISYETVPHVYSPDLRKLQSDADRGGGEVFETLRRGFRS